MPQSLSIFSHMYELAQWRTRLILRNLGSLRGDNQSNMITASGTNTKLKIFPGSENLDKLADTQALFQNDDYKKDSASLSLALFSVTVTGNRTSHHRHHLS